MDLGLADKRVMVTGATRGIGREVARIFAEEGARVAITYNSAADEAAKLVEELGGKGRAHAVRYDLRDPKSISDAVGSVGEYFGGVDVLVANAHWFTWGEAGSGYFEDMSPDGESGWINKMRANVDGQMLTVQRVVKGMRARGWGRVVLLSSVTVDHGSVGSEYYCAARSAIHGFVRGLMWSRNGVLANVVAPGATLTESVLHLAEAPGTSEMVAQEVEKTPSGRLTTPEEVARLIVFLGSDANGNINGEVIRTAGGR
jgi:3-oxoacyl-[acyl-carrier protein] reductase